MHHQYLLYFFLLSSLALNAMDERRNRKKWNFIGRAVKKLQKNSNEITIYEAVYNGDEEKVKELLDSGINVNERAKETKRSIISGRISLYDFCEITSNAN